MNDTKVNILKQSWQTLVDAVLGKQEDYTTGSIRRAIIMLSIPMILEMIMESLFALVDIFYVSKVSTEAVSTVGFTESVITLLYAIAIGLSMAVTALVARRIGEKKPKEASLVAFQSIILGTGLAIIIAVIGILYPKQILGLMGAEQAVIDEGYRYTQIMLGGNITIMLLFIINAVFRGAGDANLAMGVLWFANGLNLLLDPLFIFGFKMGVTGAAIATTIGRGLAVLVQLYLLQSKYGRVKITKKQIKLRWDMMKDLINISLGGIGQFLIGTMSWVFLMRIMAEFGSKVVAGYTIAIRVIMFTIYPAWGMSNAAATLVGQNLGAGKPDRAEKSTWITAKYVTIFMVLVSILYLVFAKNIASVFDKDLEVQKWATTSMIIFAIGYVTFSFGMVLSQAFNGAGDTKTPTLINFISFWLIQIPLAYLLAIHLGIGPKGVLWAVIISETVLALIAIYLFRKGKWKLKMV